MYRPDQICYGCLRQILVSDNLIDMCRSDVDGVSFLKKLKFCVREQLVGEARKICIQCMEHLRVAYNFKKTILTSQQILREKLKEPDVKVKIEEPDEYVELEMNSYEIATFDIKEEDAFKKPDILAKLCKDLKITRKKPTQKTRNNTNLLFHCNDCSSRFPTRQRLQQHISHKHKREKPKNICTYCNKEFSKPFHLKEHLTTHTGEKLYSCKLCDKTFQRLSSRSRHMKAHDKPPGKKTKRTPFLCTVCGKRFPFSNAVQRHMRMHLGIKTHKCEVCQKMFNQSTHLQVHMRTHTGEKPYVCDVCGKAFSLNATLRKHLVLHVDAGKKRVGRKLN